MKIRNSMNESVPVEDSAIQHKLIGLDEFTQEMKAFREEIRKLKHLIKEQNKKEEKYMGKFDPLFKKLLCNNKLYTELDDQTIFSSMRLINELIEWNEETNIEVPFISSHGSSIQFKWEKEGKYLEVEVYENKLSYFKKNHLTDEEDEGIIQEFAGVFNLLEWYSEKGESI